MRELFVRLIREEDAATATEYAIIAAVLGISLVGIFSLFRDQIRQFFGTLGTNTNNAISPN